tara:strand:- start:3364 stop:4161 length:798 start_codon:yes stop_codon:yes gene_type:complete
LKLWTSYYQSLTKITQVVLAIAVMLIAHNQPAWSEEWPDTFTQNNFRVQSQVSTEKILPAIQALPQLQEQIAEDLGITVYDETIDVMIFSSSYNFRKYIRPRIPEAANRPALFVKAPDRLYVFVTYSRSWETDLRHEVTHATLHGSMPYLPIWIDEGLAKYFEVPAELKGRNDEMLSNLKWRLRFRQPIRTRELEEMQDLTDMRTEHYRDSWAWIYFCLNHTQESRVLLQNYLKEIQNEEVPGSFVDQMLGLFPDLQQSAKNFYQ